LQQVIAKQRQLSKTLTILNSKMKIPNQKKEHQSKFLALQKIINTWDLIPGAPDDEFDDLNHRILSHLYKGADFEEISRVLESQLTETYGLTVGTDDIGRFAEEILAWWKQSGKAGLI
jgi:hypothetical protein